jgi:hypothetical protein
MIASDFQEIIRMESTSTKLKGAIEGMAKSPKPYRSDTVFIDEFSKWGLQRWKIYHGYISEVISTSNKVYCLCHVISWIVNNC